MANKMQNEDAFKDGMVAFEDMRQEHEDFVSDVEKRYKTYRGALEVDSEAADWESKSHPPYIMHIVETSLASLIDPDLKFKIRPRPTVRNLSDTENADRTRVGAEAHQVLFDWQLRQDNFTDKQRAFVLQNAIAGMSVMKTLWTTRRERRRYADVVNEPMLNEQGIPLLGPDGQPITFPRLVTRQRTDVTYDGPTSEVVDVRDFLWTPNARSLETCPKVIHRVWKTPDEMWDGFKDGGPYGPKRGGWTEEECRAILATAKDSSNEILPYRENDLFNIERTKGLVEVWEIWDREKKTVTTVAGRSVLLAHREGFPFFHEDVPFVVLTTQPDLFRIPGISQVEKVAHLQTLLWSIQNQSLDNLRLVNNAIFWFRPDIEDPDAYEFYPGARWPVEDPQQIQAWTPPPLPAEVSLGREGLIKGDMQNLAGGFPFSSGTDSQFVDQKTATGASIVSNLAQRSMDMSKQQIYAAWKKIGEQRMVLNQQFIREPVVAPVVGLDDEAELQVIWPELLAGDFEFTLEPMPDMAMKQEEQASANALLQVVLAAFPVITAAAQMGGAKPLNLDAFMEDLLKSYGKEDLQRYFTAAPAPPQQQQGPPGMPGVAPIGPQAQGVTAPQSIDPAVSPSSGLSMSPIAHLQRAQALDRS